MTGSFMACAALSGFCIRTEMLTHKMYLEAFPPLEPFGTAREELLLIL